MALEIHDDATADLRQIRSDDPVAFGRLFALLQHLRADETAQTKLLDHGFGSNKDEDFSVSKWLSTFRRVPAWRLKFWDLEKQGLKYRIIYVWVWRERAFYVMAVVRRDTLDYDDINDPIRQRVARSCRADFPDL
ncbi:MAG: hypothetical protein REU00_17515 [Pseudomonadota bacterium]|nr:hypothetical protein [Pseudomonadota bacterium]